VIASSEFFVLASAHLLCLLSPGPDFFLLVGNTARHGGRHGFGAAVGIACANAGYIACALAGFGLLTESSSAFTVVRWLGATYLGWLGFGLVKSARTPRVLVVGQGRDGRQTFRSGWVTGFLSGALNPKNGLFYLGVFSFAVSPQTPVAVRAGYGLWMFSVVLIWDALLVRCLSATSALQALQRHVPKIEGISGACLLGLAIVIAVGAG
jgi:threonine/homoserine/homoserine lactone efflux protein